MPVNGPRRPPPPTWAKGNGRESCSAMGKCAAVPREELLDALMALIEEL
ncbi:MAG: hypothetical protein ACLS43_05080 [Evtepia gabavorous]